MFHWLITSKNSPTYTSTATIAAVAIFHRCCITPWPQFWHCWTNYSKVLYPGGCKHSKTDLHSNLLGFQPRFMVACVCVSINVVPPYLSDCLSGNVRTSSAILTLLVLVHMLWQTIKAFIYHYLLPWSWGERWFNSQIPIYVVPVWRGKLECLRSFLPSLSRLNCWRTLNNLWWVRCGYVAEERWRMERLMSSRLARDGDINR